MLRLRPIRVLPALALLGLLLHSRPSATAAWGGPVEEAAPAGPEPRPAAAPEASGSGDGATARSGPYRFRLSPGARVTYRIAFTNTGSSTWRASAGYVLKNRVTGNEFGLGGCDGLRPGWTCAWTVDAVAGTAPGPRRVRWRYRMHRRGIPFGEAVQVTLVVPGPGAPPLPSPADLATVRTGKPTSR